MPVNSKIFPRWMQEFKRFQALKSQFFLYGNVYDCYYFPVNYHQAESNSDLKWARFNDIRYLLNLYLKNEGYEIIVYYDMIDGLTVESIDPEISGKNLLQQLGDNDSKVKSYFGSKKIDSIEKNVAGKNPCEQYPANHRPVQIWNQRKFLGGFRKSKDR